MPTEETENSTFPFDAWVKKIGMNRHSTGILRDNDLVTKVALSALTEEEIKEIGLSLGQRKTLVSAITDLKAENTVSSGDNNGQDTSSGSSTTTSQANTTTTNQTTLDQMISAVCNATTTPGGSIQSSGMHSLLQPGSTHGTGGTPGSFTNFTDRSQRIDLNPLVYLANPNPEYLDITDFVPQVKISTGQNQEQTVTSSDDVQLILKSGPKKPKLQDIDQALYMAASSRILAHLLNTGKINSNQVPHYLAYMVKIGMLAQRYQWMSVLLYDREYRKLQSAYNFPWGSDTQHLAQVYLVEKMNKKVHVLKPNDVQKKENQCCRLFNHSVCPYGTNCRYAHLCLICKQSHTIKEHK